MADKLHRLFEYRALLSTPGATAAETARLQRMRTQLQPGVPALDDRDPYTVLSEPVRVELGIGGRFRTGHVCNAAADGLAIAVEDPPALEQRIHVHIYDRAGGHAYSAFGRVVARVVSGIQGISIALEGAPTQTRLLPRSSGVFRASVDADETKPSLPLGKGDRFGS